MVIFTSVLWRTPMSHERTLCHHQQGAIAALGKVQFIFRAKMLFL